MYTYMFPFILSDISHHYQESDIDAKKSLM